MSKDENFKDFKTQNKSNCEDNSSINDSNKTKSENKETIDREALLKELKIFDISLDAIYVVLMALIINIEFVTLERAKILDQLNNTEFTKGAPDDTNWPRLTNSMYLYTTGIFLWLNYSLYEESISPESDSTIREQRIAFRAFLSSLLVFIATGLSKANLEV